MASNSRSTTLYNNNGNGFTLTASFNENSTNVANNTSNITCTATFSARGANWSTSYASSLTIYWHDNRENYDRQVASISFAGINKWETKTASGIINVTHHDDGTLSGYAYAYFNKGGTTTSWACNSGGVSTDWTGLTTIARASQPTISPSTTFNIGDTITINTNRKSSAFTHTITLYFGNYSYQIGTGITDSIAFDTSTIANEMYQQIPNAKVGEGNVTAVTYNGSTQIGTKNVIFKANVTNSDPTFSMEYEDINSRTETITDNNQQIIRNNSNLQVAVTNAQAKNYATLDRAEVVINGTTYTGSFRGSNSTIDVGTLNLSSNTTAVVSVIDSRGIATSKNLEITILDWVLPSAIINLQRENNFYSETNINVNAEYSSLDNKNTISIKVREKQVNSSTWSAYTDLQDEVTTQLNLDNNYAWNIQVLVEDKIGTTTYNIILDRGIPILYIDRLKRSLGIDCFPQKQESLELGGKTIADIIYPVGSIYLSVNNVDPSTLFGGTWVQIKDKFLLSAGDTYTGGATGGEATVTLTEPQLPNVSGSWVIHGQENGTEFWQAHGKATGSTISGSYKAITEARTGANSLGSPGFSFGNNQAHNNMPPYLVVYMWKRTA